MLNQGSDVFSRMEKLSISLGIELEIRETPGDQLKTQGPKSALHNLQSKEYPQVWKLVQTSHPLMNLGDRSMETCYIIL